VRAAIRKLDHVFAVLDDAPRALRFMHEVLGLPLAWPFANYGSFASGGINLGNLNLELVQAQSGRTAQHPARISGVAFEPAAPIDDAFVAGLDRRGIVHSPPMPAAAWTNIAFSNLADDGTMVFATDYHAPQAKDEALHRKPLDEAGGGRLRVLGATELVIGVVDVEAARRRWQGLLSPAVPDAAMRWALGRGPALRLVQHDQNEVLDLILEVASPDANRVLASLREDNDPLVGLPLSSQRR
jgi:catechol 2,3-dioxygenase-like lactoylglutathione lyase family enzyme